MAVAHECRPQLGGGALEDGLAVALHALLGLFLEVLEIRRGATGQRLEDDLLGRLPDPVEVAQPAGGRPLLGFAGRQLPQHPGRGAEGPHPVRRLAGPFQEIGDAVEGGGRIHGLRF